MVTFLAFIAVISVSLEAPMAALVCGVAAFWLTGH
jgi:hypothetical protein